MLKVLLPLIAFVVVFVGLIAVEPSPTQEQLDEQQRSEMLKKIQGEQKQLLERLGKLERKERLLRSQIDGIDKAHADYPALRESLERVNEKKKRQKKEAEKAIAGVDEEMRSVERKAEDWVRAAYNLTPDALPPGYLARVLWKADGKAITETTKLARDLQATLHIGKTAAQTAAQRVSRFLKSPYTRRTLVSAAAALATLALIESAEPLFGWVFDRWLKFLVSAAAGLIAFGGIVLLQKRKVLD